MGHWCVLHSSQKSKSQDYSFDGSQDDMLLSSSTKPASAYIHSISSTLVSLYCILDALTAEFTKDVWYQRAFTVQFQSDTATLVWSCQMNSMLWYQLCNEYRRCRNVPHLPATGNNIQVEFRMFPLSRLTVKVDQTLQQLNSNCDAWTSAQPCLSISGVPSALEKDLGLRRRHTSSLSLLTSNTSSNNIIHRLYYHNCTVKYTLIHLYDSFTVSTVKLSYQNLIVTLHTHTPTLFEHIVKKTSSFSAPLLSSGQLPTSPPSMLLEALCRSHQSSSRLAWPLIPTWSSTVTREMLQRPATSTLAPCATCAVYWLTMSPSLDSRMQHRRFQAGLLQCTVEWRTGGDFRQTTACPEQPGQSRLPEPGSHRCQAAASLATLATSEAAGRL